MAKIRPKSMHDDARSVLARVQAEFPDQYADPLEFLLRIQVNPEIPWDVRTDAAKSCRKAIHPDLQTTTHQGKDGGPIEVAAVQMMAADPQLAAMMEQLALAAVEKQNKLSDQGPAALAAEIEKGGEVIDLKAEEQKLIGQPLDDAF